MKTLYALASLCGLISIAAAQSDAFVDPGFTGTTQYAEWDTFTYASGTANAPDVAGDVGGITQIGGAALITSSGNIYSFSNDLQFSLTADSPEPLSTISLQYRLYGQEGGFLGVKLLLDDGETELAPTTSEQTYYSEGEVEFGATVDEAMHYTWDVSGYNVTSYEIVFDALMHCSLDQARLDTVAKSEVAPDPVAPEVLSTVLENGQPAVSFATVEGQTYRLEASSDGINWSAIGAEVAGDGNVQSLSDSTYAGIEVRFYRVIAH